MDVCIPCLWEGLRSYRALISVQTALRPDGSPIPDAFSGVCLGVRLGGLDARDAWQKSFCAGSNVSPHARTISNPRQVESMWKVHKYYMHGARGIAGTFEF